MLILVVPNAGLAFPESVKLLKSINGNSLKVAALPLFGNIKPSAEIEEFVNITG